MHCDPAYQWSLLSRWLVHTGWLLHFPVPALCFAGCDLMPGAGGARAVQNSRHWTSLRLLPALLYRSCFLTALFASPPQPWAATDTSQPFFFPIGTRVSRAEDECLGMPHPPTYSEICSVTVLPLKHPLGQQNVDVSTQDAYSSVPH